MDIYEFIAKMAEQHKSLLKVIDLQNNSIQSLNNRMNALGASQLVIFALLMEVEKNEREKIVENLRTMLDNPQITRNPHLVQQLKEFLEVCEDSRYDPTDAETSEDGEKAYPSWFKGIVQGGLSLLHIDPKEEGNNEDLSSRSKKSND
jgi:hypothetical protein